MVWKFDLLKQHSVRSARCNPTLKRAGIAVGLSVMFALGYPAAARGQISKLLKARGFQGPPAGGAVAQNSKTVPAQLQNVGIDQELNHQIPLDLVFHDETGKTVRLGDYFGTKPVIMSLVYFNCPQLCPMVEDGLVMSLRELKFDVGKQFNVLTVSFDPNDTPAQAYSKKAAYLSMYNRRGASDGWHFLTGDAASIEALTQALGYHYKYDPKIQQFSHAAAIVVLTPQGKIARYFYGITYPSGQVRLALVDASHGKIGNPVDSVLLFCSHYDPTTGKYSLLITRVLFLGALLTVVLLAAFLMILFRGGSKAQARAFATGKSLRAER